MASPRTLEQRFQAAVQKIQNLPASGPIQPSNLTKLIFYGLYKQATIGPCNEAQPSAFNIVRRAKWEAWDRHRALSKEEAMSAYIEEVRKIIATLPQSVELVAFSKLIEPPSEVADDSAQTATNDQPVQIRSNDRRVPVRAESVSSSDLDEFFDDPSDGLPSNQYEMISSTNNQHVPMAANGHAAVASNERSSSSRNRSHYSNGSSHRHGSQSNHSTSSTMDNPNRTTQRAILSALTKLQNDVHDILERLNRLETLTQRLQQKELLAAQSKSALSWFPLSGLRRRAIAFILLWPFLAFALVRLFLHAKIIIRFRQRRIV